MNGFALNIDDSFLKTLAEVDKQMSSLMKKKTKFSKGIVEAFQEISKSGVEPFVAKLKQTQDALKAISNVPIQGKASAKLKKLQTDASLCADNVNKLILAMQGLTTSADTQREWKAFDNVQRVNKLYSERIHYMQQIESIVRKGMTSELVNTSAVTSQISTLQTKLQAIEVEIGKYNSNVKNLSKATINALTKGEADFTLAEEKELKKRLEARRKTSEEILKLENKLQKVVDKKNKLVNTAAYQSGNANAIRSYNDLIAREQDLQNKIITMRNNLGALLAEIERKYAAEGAAKEVAEIQAAEDKKLQIAKDRMAKQLAESKKYGNISSASAMRLLGFSGNATNVAQEQAAIDKLKQARNQLNKTDANYQQTLDALNKKIAEHEHNIKMATDATYRKAQADKATLQQNTTYQGAMTYSRQTKTIQEQIQAIEYLKQARDKLDKTTMSQRDYEESVKRLNKEIRRQQEEVDRLRDKQGALGKSHRNLMDTAGQLGRSLALVFSVSHIMGYVNQMVNIRREMELQHRSLQVLIQDRYEADKLWQQTVDLAVRSPFRVKELVTYTRQLAAYRIETDKLHDTTRRLADVSSGLGVDMNRLILAYGQVRAAEYLRGTELRQFSEAGIPMLDELAKYFSKLEDRAVSAGDVFERVSKRMVSFEDVNEVFQRMTNKGGVFFQMQEKQSETLHGIISNFHDSIDLMLNDLGAANDGMLKGTVLLFRDFVQNWRLFAEILTQIGTVAVIALLRKQILNLLALSPKIYAMAGSLASFNVVSRALNISIIRFVGSLKALGAAMLTPHGILIGFVATLASAIRGFMAWQKAIDASNEKYDQLSEREANSIRNLQEINDAIKENNSIIKDNIAGVEAKTKAEKDNEEQLETLKSKYPDVYKGLVLQKDGTIDATKAIEQQNKMLRINIALQQQAKGGMLQEDFSTNYQDALKEYQSVVSSITKVQSQALRSIVGLTSALQDGDISEETFKSLSELFGRFSKAETFDDIKRLNDEFAEFQKTLLSNQDEYTRVIKLTDGLRDAYSGLFKAQSNYSYHLENWFDNIDNQMDSFVVGARAKLESVTDENLGKTLAGDWITEELKKLGAVNEELLKKAQEYVQSQLSDLKIGITFAENGDPVYNLEEHWRKQIWDAIEQVQSTNPDIRLGVTLKEMATKDRSELIKKLQDSVNNAMKINDETIEVGKLSMQVAFTDEQIDAAERAKPLLEFLANLVGVIEKTNTRGSYAKDWISEVVKSIRDAHKEYLSLNKTLDDASAKEMTLAKYANLFKEAAQNTQFKDMNLDDFDFSTEEGTIQALEDMLNELPESAKKARLSIQKALTEIRGEQTVTLKVEEDKALLDKIEDMFSGYEMSIELQKLNIPPDLAKQMFNIDTLTLPELKNKVVSMESQFVGTDMEEEYRKFLKKIDEMEEKAQMERLKKYSKYLIKAQSERVKIKLEEMRQLAEIEDTFQLKEKVAKSDTFGMTNDEWLAYQNILSSKKEINKETLEGIGLSQELVDKIISYNEQMQLSKTLAMEGVRKDTQEKMSKAQFNTFKESSAYQMLFQDVEYYSKDTIKIIEDGLKKVRANLKHLGISELKELTEFENKLFDIKLDKNPFTELKDSLKEIKKLQEKGITPDTENAKILASEEEIERLQKTLDLINIIQQKGVDGFDFIDIEDTQQYNMLLGRTKEELSNIAEEAQEGIDKQQGIKTAAEKNLGVYNKASKAAQAAFLKANNTVEQLSNAYNSLSIMLDSVGVNMEQSDNAVKNIGLGLVDLAMQFAMMVVQAELMGVAINAAMGPIGWAAAALTAVATIFTGIFGAHDKKREKQIKKEQELIENLQKAYEKLEEKIENAYNINTLESANNKAEANLRAQIAARQRQIALEEDKKKTDQDAINEYKAEIEELRETLEELEEKRIKALGGFGSEEAYKSATEEFVSAWLNAYKEAGDGLSGLEEQFKEFFEDMVKNQLMMRGVDKFLDPFYKQFDAMFSETSDLGGKVSKNEIDAIKSMWDTISPELNTFMQGLVESLGIASDLTSGTTELSGLQRGIQSVSEETAQIIEAYLNSIRFFVAEQTTYLSQIASSFGNTEMENPMVSELKTQTEMIRAIRDMFSSVIRNGHPTFGGAFIKVAL